MATDSSPLIGTSHSQQTSYSSTASSPEDIAEAELTEEELREYERGIISWSRATRYDFWFRREWFWGYITGIILIILVTLMSVFHHKACLSDEIVDFLMPMVKDLRKLKVGWLIPIGLIIVLSFPPLFGNEIVMLLVGFVWGLGKGSGIVAVGVILGESAVYAMFKSCCRTRAEKMTRKDLNYACLSQAITEGGFFMAWIVRLSIIPTHFTTAVLAVCGLQFYHFLAALVLGLPKQIVAVYAAGTVLAEHNASQSSQAVSGVVFGVGAVMTILALRFIYRRMTSVRKKVLLAMRDDLRSKGVSAPDASSGGSEISEDTLRP